MSVDTGVGCAFAGGVEAGGLLLPLSPPKSRLQAETSIVNTSTSPMHFHIQSGFFNAHVCISCLLQNHLNRLPSCSLFSRTNQRTPEPDTRLSAASSGSAIPPVQLGHEQVHHCCKRSFPALAGKAPDATVSSPEQAALSGVRRATGIMAPLAPRDVKAPFRVDLADPGDPPGLLLYPHGKPIVDIPTASEPVGIPTPQRQGQGIQGGRISALIRDATADKPPPGSDHVRFRMLVLQRTCVLVPGCLVILVVDRLAECYQDLGNGTSEAGSRRGRRRRERCRCLRRRRSGGWQGAHTSGCSVRKMPTGHPATHHQQDREAHQEHAARLPALLLLGGPHVAGAHGHDQERRGEDDDGPEHLPEWIAQCFQKHVHRSPLFSTATERVYHVHIAGSPWCSKTSASQERLTGMEARSFPVV